MLSARGAWTRRADARLGSAHARNCRGCRQIEAVNTTQYCHGVPSKIDRVSIKRNKNTGIRFNEPATNLAIQHTMTNSSRKQQHCCQAASNNNSIATHRAATAAAAAAAAALCMHIKLTFRLLRRHVNHHRTYFCTCNKI